MKSEHVQSLYLQRRNNSLITLHKSVFNNLGQKAAAGKVVEDLSSGWERILSLLGTSSFKFSLSFFVGSFIA